MADHEKTAEALEREADDMEHRSKQVGEDIEAAREDWERKKADGSVPGAGGDPQRAEGGLPPEANYTTRGDEPPDGDGGSRMPPPEPDETD
jgi:hypothetical protein